MQPWLQLVITAGGALITLLLLVIAYFLREIHTDFKDMRTEIEKLSIWAGVKDALFQQLEKRVSAIEKKISE